MSTSKIRRLDVNACRPCQWYDIWMRIKDPHMYMVTTLARLWHGPKLKCQVWLWLLWPLELRQKQGLHQHDWSFLRSTICGFCLNRWPLHKPTRIVPKKGCGGTSNARMYYKSTFSRDFEVVSTIERSHNDKPIFLLFPNFKEIGNGDNHVGDDEATCGWNYICFIQIRTNSF